MKRAFLFGVIVFLIIITGCTTGLRNKQLEKIPVYPLTEDLQPGDVLLVSVPIEEQVSIYKEKGFLPLDQLLVRIYSKDIMASFSGQHEVSKDFENFYNLRYGITGDDIPPAQWQKPKGDVAHNWEVAPRAAFPTYQFSVRTGTGLNLAIPIQGVPFALGLMNSGSASGTVTIADAYTYGLDNIRLERVVREWAKSNRKFLRCYTPRENQYHFLRIVSRIYVTGRVSVTVNNDEAISAEAGGGADRPVKLMGITEGDTKVNYVTAIDSINKIAKDILPGGKIKIATASSRSVTLSETFTRPLVIGYVGFDMPILNGGRLGTAISTLAQLKNQKLISTSLEGSVYRLGALAQMYQALKNISGKEAGRIRGELDKLNNLLPDQYPFSLYVYVDQTTIEKDSQIVSSAQIDRKGFQSVTDYLGNAQMTVDTLGSYLPTAHRETEMERKKVSQLTLEYEFAQAALVDMQSQVNQEPALMEAIDFVFLSN